MKFVAFTLAVAALPLAACQNSAKDKLAGRVENAADTRADMLDNRAASLDAQANILKAQADHVRNTGASRADAIKAADQNVAAMSQAQRDAIVANQAAAVR